MLSIWLILPSTNACGMYLKLFGAAVIGSFLSLITIPFCMSKLINSTVYGHLASVQLGAITNIASDSTSSVSNSANNYYQSYCFEHSCTSSFLENNLLPIPLGI